LLDRDFSEPVQMTSRKPINSITIVIGGGIGLFAPLGVVKWLLQQSLMTLEF
jgi:hypothetical protein